MGTEDNIKSIQSLYGAFGTAMWDQSSRRDRRRRLGIGHEFYGGAVVRGSPREGRRRLVLRGIRVDDGGGGVHPSHVRRK